MSDEKTTRLPDPDVPPDDATPRDALAPGADAEGAPLPVPVPTGEPPVPDDTGMPQFVSVLASMEQQVGSHVIAALQHPETVAVLTTVAMGQDGHQRMVSVGLDPEMVEQVRDLVAEAAQAKTNDVPCVGFHCRINEDDVARKEKERTGGES